MQPSRAPSTNDTRRVFMPSCTEVSNQPDSSESSDSEMEEDGHSPVSSSQFKPLFDHIAQTTCASNRSVIFGHSTEPRPITSEPLGAGDLRHRLKRRAEQVTGQEAVPTLETDSSTSKRVRPPAPQASQPIDFSRISHPLPANIVQVLDGSRQTLSPRLISNILTALPMPSLEQRQDSVQKEAIGQRAADIVRALLPDLEDMSATNGSHPPLSPRDLNKLMFALENMSDKGDATRLLAQITRLQLTRGQDVGMLLLQEGDRSDGRAPSYRMLRNLLVQVNRCSADHSTREAFQDQLTNQLSVAPAGARDLHHVGTMNHMICCELPFTPALKRLLDQCVRILDLDPPGPAATGRLGYLMQIAVQATPTQWRAAGPVELDLHGVTDSALLRELICSAVGKLRNGDKFPHSTVERANELRFVTGSRTDGTTRPIVHSVLTELGCSYHMNNHGKFLVKSS